MASLSYGQTRQPVMATNTNGRISSPTNFFTTNIVVFGTLVKYATNNGGIAIGSGAGTAVNDGDTLSTGLYGPTPTETNQYVTKMYVDSLASGGSTMFFYGSSNSPIAVGTCLVTNYGLASPSPRVAVTNDVTVTAPDQYVAAYVSTQIFNSVLSGPVQTEIYCFENTAGSLSIHAEFYVWDETNSTLTELGSTPNQIVNAGAAPTRLQFTIGSSDFGPTNNLRYIVRFKSASVTGTPTLSLVTEGLYTSHAMFNTPQGEISGITAATGTNIAAYQALIATNDLNTVIRANITNHTLLKATDGTNHANALSVNGTNYSLLIGANGTNESLRLAGLNTNHTDALSVNATNEALRLAGLNTNHTDLKAANGTNYTLVVGANSTNESLRLADLNTNYTLIVGANATNEALRLAGLNTNQTDAVSNVLAGKIVDSTNSSTSIARTNVNLSIYADWDFAGKATGYRQTNLTGTAYWSTNLSAGTLPDASVASQWFITNASFTIGGFANTLATHRSLFSLCVSNAHDSAITVTFPVGTYFIGYTNGLTIPAAKEAYISFEVRAQQRTNAMIATQYP